MFGHGVPILPKGDPQAEKPEPRLHLDNDVHNDEAVRQEIIEEEELKEAEAAPIPEPKEEIHDLADDFMASVRRDKTINLPLEDQDKPKPFLASPGRPKNGAATRTKWPQLLPA